MSFLRMLPSISTTQPTLNLSSLTISTNRITHLQITPPRRTTTTIIRMGGGPRTFPGGVSKWQWKRMQAKKQKQLLKARLSRERQIYEMRKRAELRAAVSELERPWEIVERAPNLFSVAADDQLKSLADRFHKPGGYDLWSDRDGPQLFHTPDGLPSARFLPKNAVHSVKPYGIKTKLEVEEDGGGKRRGRKSDLVHGMGNLRIKKNVESGGSEKLGLDENSERSRRNYVVRRGRKGSDADARRTDSRSREVYDMSLKNDGSYELQSGMQENMFLSSGLKDDFELD